MTYTAPEANNGTQRAMPPIELSYSKVESSRFGLRVFRVVLDDLDTDDLLATILREQPDVVIGRLPAVNQGQLARLDRLGIPWVSADSLVHYYADLDRFQPTALRNQDLEFSEATPDDADLLGSLIEEIFPGYTNHYYSNPVLDRSSILEGYVEWANGYIGGGDSDVTVWLAHRGDTPVAFATCRYTPDEAEGVLYGVRPNESGKGVYGDLIRFTLADSKKRGVERMHVSTQVQNFAVQAAWVRQGFVMRDALVTFHINAMLSASRVPPLTREITLEENAGIGAAVDDAIGSLAATALGSPVGIRRTNHLYLLPSEPGEPYTVNVSLPPHPDPHETPAVARVTDGGGRTHHLAYYALDVL